MIGILLALSLLAACYWLGTRASPPPERYSRLAFWSGWASLAIALLPPMHEWSERFFSVHMVQHTIMITIAAPLLVLGRPVLTSLWAVPARWRRRAAHHGLAKVLRTIAEMPMPLAFALHAAAIWVWHIPSLYDAAVQSEPLHAAQHLSFLLTAILFWNSVLAPRTRSHALGKGVLFVFATAAHTAVLGAMIALASTPLYQAYPNALADQQLAGFIMWVPAGLLYTLAAAALLAAWFKQLEKRNSVRRAVAASAIVILVGALASGCHAYEREDALDEKTAAALTGGDPRVGKETIEQAGCGGCHTIAGVRSANGEVGPPLDGIAHRTYIGGVITNTPDHLAAWIRDPKAIDSLTAMPALGLTPKAARDVAAYLYTLR